MSETIIIAIVGAVSAIAGAWLGSRAIMQRTRSDNKKTDAETDHTLADTARDLIEQIKLVYESRISNLESQVVVLRIQLDEEQKKNRRDIIELNERLGRMMHSAEAQSNEIGRLIRQVELWRLRVNELLRLLREHGATLPEWTRDESALSQTEPA